jgi:hypothetical protein
MRLLALLPAAALALLAGCFAFAAVAQDTVITAEPWVATFLPFVTAITVALIGTLVPLIFAYVLKKWGLDVDKEHRDAFQTSVTNAAGLLLQRAAASASTAKIDVGSPMMAEAIRYVQERAPDALKKWGITPDMIAKSIVAKIPQIEASSGAAPMSTPSL